MGCTKSQDDRKAQHAKVRDSRGILQEIVVNIEQ